MGPIDGSVISVALPTFSRVFHVGLNTVGWVSMAYLLVLGSLILTYGRLGDMFGFKRIFLLGVALFTAASAVCALAPDIWTLIAFRAVQAIGAGMFMAMAPAIIAATFPAGERGRALGLFGMTAAVGLSLGPSLGGLLLSVSSWQSIFLINLPVGVIGYLLCSRTLPDQTELKRQRFDLVGAAAGFVSLGSLLLAGSYGEEWGWSSTPTVGLAAAFLVTSAAFIWWERRVTQPMLELSLFRNLAFSAACFSSLMNFVSQSALVFLVPFYLQQILAWTPKQTGLIMTVSPLVVLVVVPFSGSLSDRIGTRWLSFVGQALMAVGFVLLYRLTPTAGAFDIAWRIGVVGLGVGIFQSPNNSTIMGNCPRHLLGTGSGVLATVRTAGMVLGVAVSTGVFEWRRSAMAVTLGPAGSYLSGLRLAFLVAACLAAVGALTSSVRSDDWRNAG
jgi:EmrB/QacA subfamily drug resistance transporter